MTARDESPARIPSGRIGLHVKNALLMLASVVASLMMAEAVVRYIDGLHYSSLGASEAARIVSAT